MTAADERPGADVSGPTLLAGARLAGEAGLFDLHLDDGVIKTIAPAGDSAAPVGAHRVELDGRWVVP